MLDDLSSREFRRFQALVQSEAGILLPDQQRGLLAGSLLPRLRALEMTSFAAYYERVWTDHDELTRMIDALCSSDTRFFREPKQFEFLEQEVLPAWRAAARAGLRAERVRVWSAGCGTGEEPFSIAMSLAWHLPNWSIEIVASDVSPKVLERAATAVWPQERAQELPPHYRKTFMQRQDGTMVPRPELASLVRFTRMDLNEDSHAVMGRFDLIFCRNVLIYFDAESRTLALRRLLPRLAPDGYFFVGHSESLDDVGMVRAVGPHAYANSE